MKKYILAVLILNQSAFASDLDDVSRDLGKVYQKAVQLQVESVQQKNVKKFIVETASASFLKLNFLPLLEMEDQLKSLNIVPIEGEPWGTELSVQVATSISFQECQNLQGFYLNFEENLSKVVLNLEEVFYSTSPYQTELTHYQKMREPLQENFSSNINMNEGITRLETMIEEFSVIGFKLNKRVSGTQAQFSYDQEIFRQKYGVLELGQLSAQQKKEVLIALAKGPLRNLNYLKSMQVFISQRYGVAGLEQLVKEIITKLKSN